MYIQPLPTLAFRIPTDVKFLAVSIMKETLIKPGRSRLQRFGAADSRRPQAAQPGREYHMSQAIKIATIRGAGLSFPIACLHFVFFGQPYIFSLILAGALAGFALGAYFERYPTAKNAWKTA